MAVQPSGHVLALLKGAEEGKGSGSYPMDSRSTAKSHSRPRSHQGEGSHNKEGGSRFIGTSR